MINALVPPAERSHMCIQFNLLCSREPHTGRKVCVWVCVFAQAQKSLCHSKAPQVNDIIHATVGLQRVGIRSVCVCAVLCVIHYHFSHEKMRKNTHHLPPKQIRTLVLIISIQVKLKGPIHVYTTQTSAWLHTCCSSRFRWHPVTVAPNAEAPFLPAANLKKKNTKNLFSCTIHKKIKCYLISLAAKLFDS